MSADNCIAILVSPVFRNNKKIGDEARVIHAQAIENIQYDDGTLVEGYNPRYLTDYFGECEPVSVNEGSKIAEEMAEEVMSDEFCPVLEYGILTYTLKEPFSYYQKIAEIDKKIYDKIKKNLHERGR